ncbi:unnamed protein product, partial [Nippostrongylus brasiliensis]|uniref:DUF1758 domain-containing protein n=1 Tax=Nippostrongylus brasiliensis TaxID=27835 RepID=A0A0N4XFI3_NIPBR
MCVSSNKRINGNGKNEEHHGKQLKYWASYPPKQLPLQEPKQQGGQEISIFDRFVAMKSLENWSTFVERRFGRKYLYNQSAWQALFILGLAIEVVVPQIGAVGLTRNWYLPNVCKKKINTSVVPTRQKSIQLANKKRPSICSQATNKQEMEQGQRFQLSNCKRKLTLFCKKLDSTIAEAKEVAGKAEDLKLAQGKLTAIEPYAKKVEDPQQEYATSLDKLERAPSTQEAVDYEQYHTMSEKTLVAACEIAVELSALLRTTASTTREQASTLQLLSATTVATEQPLSSSETGQQGAVPALSRVNLPAISIPSFTGNCWDWDNFWTLFNANVHSQPIPDLFKFNHLLNALKGEPRQAIMRFQVSVANYAKTIDFLKAKYSDKETTIHTLIQRLEAATLQSTSLKDQRMLLDQLHIVIAQLRDKGENVDSQWLVKQVLAKFPQQVQREILRRKCSMEEPFSMLWLLNTLDKYISSYEKIATMASNDKGKQPARDERPAKGQSQRQIPLCMYCNQPHKAASCTRYTTPQERANYLRQHKLCMICASPQHSTEECKRRNCFGCQGWHHTSCCFKQKVATATPDANPTQRKNKIPSTTANPKARNNNPRQQKQVKQFTTQYHEEESSEQENQDEDVESIAEFHASKQILGIGETFLPIGELTILDPSTRKLRKIPALLDSGAECSFIDQRLADELNLPSMSNTTLRVRTFGAPNDLECQTRKVPLDIWDSDGEPCQLQLLTHNILTSSLRTPPILEEDAAFIRQNHLQVHVVSKRKAKPQILLGSDQLWQLIHADKPHVRLPSGLYLLPTRVGHLLTELGHIASQDNPADVATRGIDKESFPEHFWWNGPLFLAQPREQWSRAYRPLSIVETKYEVDPEDPLPTQSVDGPRQTQVLAQTATAYVDIFKIIKRTELGSVRRIVTFVLRFIHNTVARRNAKKATHIQLSPLFDEAKPSYSAILDGLEIRRAIKTMVKQHQMASIAPTTQAAFKYLNLYIDHQGILRLRAASRPDNVSSEKASSQSFAKLASTHLEAWKNRRASQQQRWDDTRSSGETTIKENSQKTASSPRPIGAGNPRNRQQAGAKSTTFRQIKRRPTGRPTTQGVGNDPHQTRYNLRIRRRNDYTEVDSVAIMLVIVLRDNQNSNQMSAEQVSMDDSEAQQSTTTPESVTMNDKKNQLTQVMPSKRRKNSDDASHASQVQGRVNPDYLGEATCALQGSSEITNIDKQTGLKQKRKREQPKSSELDEYAEVSFWLRVINSPDCKWPVINRTLEHLNTQWTKRKQVAAGIVTKWRSIMVSKDSATEEQKQDEILKLLMNARDEKERLATIGSRFIAMSLIHKDQAKQAGITEQQLDREIRTTIKEMEKECETLEALLETMQNEHKKSIQKQRIHAHEIESERDDIWDQLQQLLAEKSRWDETLKELQAHRDHWRMRAAEEEQYEEKLKTRMQELQNELDAAANKNKAVQEDLNKRMQELEQQCMHLNSQLTKPTSSRAQQEPTTERKQLSSNP